MSEPSEDRFNLVSGSSPLQPTSARARQLSGLIPFKPGQSGNPSGKSGFYHEATKAARAMTPAAVRRLGELAGLLPAANGEWIPLPELISTIGDARVISVAAMAIVERVLGKPREYDPTQDREPSRLDLSKLTADQRQQLRELLTQAIASNTTTPAGSAETASAADETTVE